MRNLISVLVLGLGTMLFTGCSIFDDATIASHNLSKAADNFEINRRIVFYNGITGQYMLVIKGRCSIEHSKKQLEVTCKVGPNEYKKHFLGLSDNVTYFAEQIHSAGVNVYNYRVTFKPQVIVPDVRLRGSSKALEKAVTPNN